MGKGVFKLMPYLAFVSIYLLIIFIMQIIPMGTLLSDTTVIFIRADYLAHILAFVPFMSFCWLYLRGNSISGSLRFLYIAGWFLIGICLAATFEILQCFLAYRTFNLMDILFNIIGVTLGMLIFLWKTDGKQN